MDQELREYLEAMESRMESRLDSRIGTLDSRIGALENRIEAMFILVVQVKESLERQINTGFSRLDAQATRLDRHAALLQTGSRWTNRMIAWSEKVDVSLEKRTQEIGEMRSRLHRIEEGL